MKLCDSCRNRLAAELREVFSELARGPRTEEAVAEAGRRGRAITEGWTREVEGLANAAAVEALEDHARRIVAGSGGGGEAA